MNIIPYSIDMKITAIACSNIALVKYWGKRDELLKLPQNNSISITLNNLQTKTTVDFDNRYEEDIYIINGKKVEQQSEIKRLNTYINLLRQQKGVKTPVKMQTESNFPTAAGLASSASGFAALTVAGSKALELTLSDTELSILARRGSGSACRSIFGGFVEWKKGQKSDGSDSYAVQIASSHHWDIQLLVIITELSKKSISSTKGMQSTVKTSPFYQGWLDSIEFDLEKVRTGILNKDFKLVGESSEHNCLKMHSLMMTSSPSMIYWNETTLKLLKNIQTWRAEGLNCYFTIDAGPNIIILCLKSDVDAIKDHIQNINNIKNIIQCSPGPAPRLSEQHLF
ncbi:MAG TPA: diphosphomevalonate decarboxylase [Candidatus Deferrimicrobium sp.]|nr:diphosphomevalonate decarboxylase [Candidatus Deferrimicrobium sp.]